jgi:hypothetical protein
VTLSTSDWKENSAAKAECMLVAESNAMAKRRIMIFSHG